MTLPTHYEIEEQLCATRLLELPDDEFTKAIGQICAGRVLECARHLAEGTAGLCREMGNPRDEAKNLNRAVALRLELRRRDPAA